MLCYQGLGEGTPADVTMAPHPATTVLQPAVFCISDLECKSAINSFLSSPWSTSTSCLGDAVFLPLLIVWYVYLQDGSSPAEPLNPKDIPLNTSINYLRCYSVQFAEVWG